ncbi:copper homeostasis protein CutC, partial [Francisella tularensis subsp. holarctica]|nr:copper homeostasis protein CutC [Francisella tularensis subsp. holarctica]
KIIPFGFINSTNVKEILETTIVTSIHCSAYKKILRDIDSLAFPVSALEIKVSQAD